MGLLNFMPGEMGGQPQGLLGGAFENPLFQAGISILANNSGHYGALGPAIGGGLQQAGQNIQRQKQMAMQQKLYDMQMQEAERKLKKDQEREEALPRLLQGESAYMQNQQVPVSSFQNVPMDPQEGAVAPNFNLQRQETTTMQEKPVFDQTRYTQDLIAAGMGDELIKQRFQTQEANYDIAPDGRMYDKKSGRIIEGQKFAKPESENLPNEVREYQFAQSQGYPGTFKDFQLELKRAGASSNNISVNTGQKGFDNTLKLRGDFRSEPIYKAHQDVQSAYSQISTSLKQASPAGDLAGATKLMKILDPGSVVRESELGMAMAASGAMDRLYNYADMVVKGTKLTPTQRTDFQNLADSLYNESAKQYNNKRAEYQGIAERNGLSVQDVLGEAEKVKEAPKPQVTALPMPKKPSALTLKKGTVYETPRGALRWNGKAFEDI